MNRAARSAPHGRTGQRLDIQGLRMLAVGSVIADHAIGWPIGGFVGVDVFFVISGFLITGLLLREYERTGRISFGDFYRRRVKRLMPAALLVLGVTVAAAAFLLPRDRALDATVDAAFAALFTVNWRMALVGTDYFAAGQAPSPIQHYWSLSVEEQFYVVWPIVLVLVLWAAGRAAAGRRARGGAVLAVAAAITIASFAWAMLETRSDEAFAYFSTLSRAWELGIGAMVAIGAHYSRFRLPPSITPWLTLLGTAGIVVSWFVVQPTPGFPAPTGLLPVLSTALVIAAGLEPTSRYERVNALLTNRVSHWIGDISYSLYLWHFPIIVLGAALLPVGSWQHVLGAVGLTVLLAWLSFRYVEDPVRRSALLTPAWRWRRASVAVATAIGLLVVGSGTATAARLSTPPPAVAAEDAAAADCLGAASLLDPGCGTDDLSGEVVPSRDALAADMGEGFACWRNEGAELASCTYGSEAPDALRVAIVGDSHAAMLLPAILPELEARSWRLDTFVGYGCQWRDDTTPDCADTMAQTMERLESGDYDVILTTAARWAVDDEGAAEDFAAAWSRAASAGAQVVAVEAVPTVAEEALSCVARVDLDARDHGCVTPLDAALQPADPLPDAVERAPGAALVEVDDLFCTESGCPAVVGGVIVYRDAVSHITATYMRTAGPELVSRIAAAAGA